MTSHEDRTRQLGFRALGEAVATLTEPMAARRGFADAALLRDWPAIVGDHLAQGCAPERIAFPPRQKSGGTLHIRVNAGTLAIELQYLQSQLIDRINTYFGFAAVQAIRFHQAHIPPARVRSDPEPPQAADASPEDRWAGDLRAVAGTDLHQALARLGRHIVTPRSEEDGAASISRSVDP